MKTNDTSRAQVPDTLRQFAEQNDAFVEPDVVSVTGWSPKTVESYRKRGEIESIKVGKHHIYPKRQFTERGTARARVVGRMNPKGLL